MRYLRSLQIGGGRRFFVVFALLGFVFGCGEDPSEDREASWRALYPMDVETGLRLPAHGPVPALPDWQDNLFSEAKDRLGRALYFDNRLSGSGKGNCTACHTNTTQFMSGLVFDIPDRSYPERTPTLDRNAPSLLNIAYAPVFRWDGSHGTNLYEQMVLPFAEANMNLTPDIPAEDFHTVDVPSAQVELKHRLTQVLPGYVDWYLEAFEQDIRALPPEEVWLLTGKALAIFIRRAVSRDSAFDKWNAGDDQAMSAEAIVGLGLFLGKAGCNRCHSGPMFTDYQFHNLSLSLPDADGHRPDEGRYKVTGDELDRGAFLTPSLRSVTKTAPYFHHGQIGSLRAVIQHIVGDASRADPLHSSLLNGLEPLADAEMEALVAFLKSLIGARLPSAAIAIPAVEYFPNTDTHPIIGGLSP